MDQRFYDMFESSPVIAGCLDDVVIKRSVQGRR